MGKQVETLDEAKDRVRRSYLGQAGIHGVGVSRVDRAIRAYASPGGSEAGLLERLRKAAEPFPVVVVVEEELPGAQ